AASASAPSASMVIMAPLPAASIITPMMLFAFTRRPLRVSQTSLLKPLATCVSLADARACSPSLLTISTSALAITTSVVLATRVRRHVQHAFRAAREGLFHGDREPLVAVGEGANQHRQIYARNAFDLAR